MIRINQIKLKPNHKMEELEKAVRKMLRLKDSQTFTYSIARRSIDARTKPEILYIYSVDVTIKGLDDKGENVFLKKLNNKNVMYTKSADYIFPTVNNSNLKDKKIIIAGCGPAGLFCGLMLAKAGLCPTILERGSDVDTRKKAVSQFWEDGSLDTECNVQFGEGGAGTFSDGKLNTQVKDSCGRIKKVLETFVEFGAKEEILYDAKPHIGTDILVDIVRGMRKEIENLGGRVFFDTKLVDINYDTKINSVELSTGEVLPCDSLILCIGHSARDTFEMLHKNGIDMMPKSFAVGVRIEHPQQLINDYAYGENIYEMDAASYKVTHRSDKRGVYSFCMCPGGYVVNASSEKERLCINGMSYSDRGSANANSAIVVTVTPEDYKMDTPLSGVEFQRQLESAAYKAGNGKIPVQTYGSFKSNKENVLKLQSCTKGRIQEANLHEVLPEYICESIIEGIEGFARQIPDFNMDEAIISAVESRTSSPVRIIRDENLFSNIMGIIPCGEGAGYAGGIISAAVDGIRAAEAAVGEYKGAKNNG